MLLPGWYCRYVECTSSAIQALTLFKKLHPEHRRHEIENCIFKAAKFIEDTQAPDGSWFVLIHLIDYFCMSAQALEIVLIAAWSLYFFVSISQLNIICRS